MKPCTRTKFVDHSFCSAGPAVWNSLPYELHHITDTDLFKRRLKTVTFLENILSLCCVLLGIFVNGPIQILYYCYYFMMLTRCWCWW